jgi:hypothetical protein
MATGRPCAGTSRAADLRLALALAVAPLAAALADDWPQWRGPEHGVSGFTNRPAEGATLRYTPPPGEAVRFFRAGVWLE